MSTGLKVGLGIAALVVVYELYSRSSSAAVTAATVAPVAAASPLAPAPGSIPPVVTPTSAGSAAQSVTSKALSLAATSSFAVVTGGLSTSTGRAIYAGVGKGVASAASSVYHGIASIF